MSISIEQAKTIIYEDIKEKYANVVEFEITSAKYNDTSSIWEIEGNFSYEITNKTLSVGYYYDVYDDGSIFGRKFNPGFRNV